MSKCKAVLDSTKVTEIRVKAKRQESAPESKRTVAAAPKSQSK